MEAHAWLERTTSAPRFSPAERVRDERFAARAEWAARQGLSAARRSETAQTHERRDDRRGLDDGSRARRAVILVDPGEVPDEMVDGPSLRGLHASAGPADLQI